MQLLNGTGMCYFGAITARIPLVDYLNAATGWDMSADEYLKTKSLENKMLRYEKEKVFLVDTIPATVFHSVSISPKGQEEHFINEKKMVLINNGKMFTVWAKFGDVKYHERVWKSFEFVD